MSSFLILAMMVGNAPHPAPCAGMTTIEINACLANRLSKADVDLKLYHSAAVRRLRKEGGNSMVKRLAQAERSWQSYRDAECDALFERYRDGTIRTSVAIECSLHLTRLRTYTIWRNWLTHPDDTPPVLPVPPFKVRSWIVADSAWPRPLGHDHRSCRVASPVPGAPMGCLRRRLACCTARASDRETVVYRTALMASIDKVGEAMRGFLPQLPGEAQTIVTAMLEPRMRLTARPPLPS